MGVRVIQPINATFIHLQKTGGTSVQDWLISNTIESFKFNKHAEIPYVKKRFPDHGTLITIVRNPYARVVSWYFYILEKTKRRIKAAENNFLGLAISEKKKFTKYNLERNYKILENLDKGFEYHVRNNIHLENQVYVAKNCDIVLKLENIKTDFKQIQDMFKCYKPLDMKNSSNHLDYRHYYDEELKRIIEQKYEKDFEYFNYDF